MKLDEDIRAQLQQYLQHLEGDVVIKVSAGSDNVSRDMLDLLDELAGMSPRIAVERAELERTPSFSVGRPGEDARIVFSGVPLDHEFTSLVLALLQVSGRTTKIDEETAERIKAIRGEYRFETYVSLFCHNCPDVVQALNIMSVLNPNISHTMIDGAAYKDKVDRKEVMAVPSVWLNGEFFESGRMSLEYILSKLGVSADVAAFANKEPFDVLVIGGGNSGVEAAIDLAGIAAHVTLFEFLPELKADQVLQDRLYSLPNVTVYKNVQVKEITGSSKMKGIVYVDRATGEEHRLPMDGVFIQIGLVPNTEWLDGTLERTRMGEIVVDSRGATDIPSVFAAGDCTNSAYKQIIISMGSGATAALSAFDYLIRN